MKNLVRLGAALPVIGAAVLGLSNSAQASLEGSFTIVPFIDVTNPTDGGLILEGTGLSAPNSDGLVVPLTNLDFVPPAGPGLPSSPGTGAIIRLSGTEDFDPFDGWTGTIGDLAFPASDCPVCIYNTGNSNPFPDPNVPDWLVIDTPGVFIPGVGGFTATLDSLTPPNYEETETGTTVTIPTTIIIRKLDGDGNVTGDPSRGDGTLSADFVDLNITEVFALFDEPGEIQLADPDDPNSGPFIRGWSGEFEVTKDVPEPTSVLGLMMLGLGGLASKTLKSKKNS